jgi:hypothetical protein
MSKRENEYQPKVIEKLNAMFPGCLVLKNDEQYLQGIPDLTVLYRDKWAVLEVKRDEKEMQNPRPNQAHYVERLNGMGFAAFICPSNEQDVFHALQRSFETDREPRSSES